MIEAMRRIALYGLGLLLASVLALTYATTSRAKAGGPLRHTCSVTDRAFIDRVQALDEAELASGRIKPTHMIAAMTKQPVSATKMHRNLSPKFCVRRTRRWI